jgi:hypothetical protein
MVFEYRASWQSTFLDAGNVYQAARIALSPGAALTGIAVPAAGEIEAIRAPSGENAARWLHLMAATVALVVIVPRLLLGLFAWLIERHRATNLPIALEDPYFQRLLRDFDGGPARVYVVPYSYTVPPAATAGLERLVARAFGAGAALTISPPRQLWRRGCAAHAPGQRSCGERDRAVQRHRNAGARGARRLPHRCCRPLQANRRAAGAGGRERLQRPLGQRCCTHRGTASRLARTLRSTPGALCLRRSRGGGGGPRVAAPQLADAETAIDTALAEATR